MKPSLIVKCSVVIHGHKTSISIEKAFWRRLKYIAARDGIGLNALVAKIEDERDHYNLSSAIRLFVFADAEKWAEIAMPIAPAAVGEAPVLAI